MNRTAIGFLLVALGFVAPLGAQKTWIVDAAKGAGWDFVDIQPAFDRAKPGDRILVRKGNYRTATTNKGVHLLGSPGAKVSSSKHTRQREAIVIRGLPANQTFVMKGFTLSEKSYGRTMLFLDGNLGPVHLEALHLSSYARLIWRMNYLPALRVRNCKQVTITESSFGGQPGLSVEGSTIALSGCSMLGVDAGQWLDITWKSRPGLWASKSRLTIARSAARSGAGLIVTPAFFGRVLASSPAAVLQDCRTAISGHASNVWQAGKITKKEKGMHAIEANGSQLLIDPTLKLIPQGKSPAVAGSAKLYRARIPSLRAVGAAPGGILRTDLYAQSGHLQLLLASGPGPVRALSIGELWLDLTAILYLDASMMDKTQHRSLAIPVPKNLRLLGIPIAFQVLSGTANRWRLSNPVVVILR